MRAARWIMSLMLLSIAFVRGERAGAQASRAPHLDRVSLDVRAISQAQGHLVYEFRVANSPASPAAVGVFGVDLSAPRGSGHQLLAVTGPFRHSASRKTAVVPRDHVPTGPVSPERWKAALDVNGLLRWYGTSGGVVDLDSIAAGQFLDGFGVRSTYLPGIRTFWAQPTWQSCCSEPKPGNAEGEHPRTSEFRWTGRTVAPAVRPSEMTLTLLGRQLAETCALRWTSASNCSALRTILDRARAFAADRDRRNAISQLESFLAALDERRADEASLQPNAYWLLRTNAQHLTLQFRE